MCRDFCDSAPPRCRAPFSWPVSRRIRRGGAARGSAVPMTYDVTTTADSGAGSLRDAILQANANAGEDTITFHVTAELADRPRDADRHHRGDHHRRRRQPRAENRWRGRSRWVAPGRAIAAADTSPSAISPSTDRPEIPPTYGQRDLSVRRAQTAQTVTVDRVVSRYLTSERRCTARHLRHGSGRQRHGGGLDVRRQRRRSSRADRSHSAASAARSRSPDPRSPTTGRAATAARSISTAPAAGRRLSPLLEHLHRQPGRGTRGRGGAIFANYVAGFSVADSVSRAAQRSTAAAPSRSSVWPQAPPTSRSSARRSSATSRGQAAERSSSAPPSGVVAPGITIDSSTFSANFLTAGSGHSIAFTSHRRVRCRRVDGRPGLGGQFDVR